MRGILALFLLLSGIPLTAQETTSPAQGLRDNSARQHAIINAKIMVAPGREIQSGTILVDDGIIRAVGSDIKTPGGYRVWDLTGKTVYAGFIDAYVSQSAPPSEEQKEDEPEPAPPVAGPVSWNVNVKSHRRVLDDLNLDQEAIDKYRKLGFATIQIVAAQGVFRGESAVVQLVDAKANPTVFDTTTQIVALESGAYDGNVYPSSLMGAIALIRQTFYDAQWYGRANLAYNNHTEGERPEVNHSLAALTKVISAQQTVIFETNDELDFARVFRIGSEFDLDAAVTGNGYEYRSLSTLQEFGKTIIVPLTFPKAPAVENAEKALDVSLATLQHWELAPSNPAFLADGDVRFALTTHGLEKPDKEFWSNLRKAVDRGLAPSEALAALTTEPAKVLGLDTRLGSIEKDKVANLIVAGDNLFSDDTSSIEIVWVDGEPFLTDEYDAIDPRGTWAMNWSKTTGPSTITIEGTLKELKGKSNDGEALEITLEDQQILIFPSNGNRAVAYLQNDTLTGSGEDSKGGQFNFSGRRTKAWQAPDRKTEENDDSVPLVWRQFPAGAFGILDEPETVDSLLIRNATVWTSAKEGRIENADLLVRRGRINGVGSKLSPPRGTQIIDAQGKHITPGLIDAHSHSGSSGDLNEATHAVTVEVRVGDVINPTDISLYRELAGGLTVANQLHGSANPMGGQSQVIKLRWGQNAEALKFQGAPPGVKFALGENVKQSNWGDDFVTRYPQSRMGVEEIMRDTFNAARDYAKKWQQFRSKKTKLRPRRDLRMDAALEILNKTRWVHIHSYRQDEVLMFVRLAQEFGIKVGTFQHILEGYKVADAIAEIGAGASTFSDWWAYKFEVYDAIPYNGALMHNAGVVTSFNSDSDELARRLNTEAAKAIKYGGVSEIEALKFVTINPAKQLGISDRVGSLEVGKDADFVIWNASPLSTYAVPEQTWIDGTKYFDIEVDGAMRIHIAKERERLITKATTQRLKESKKKDESKKGPDHSLYHDGRSQYRCTQERAHQC